MEVVISARVSEEAMEYLKKRKVNISEIVRQSLIREMETRKAKESLEALDRIGNTLRKINRKELLKSIREDRDEAH